MIFKREFMKNIKSLIIWSTVLGGLILVMLSVFPQFAENQNAMKQMLEAYPDAMKKMFGMDKLDFGTILGYYGVEIYVMTTLIGSIYAAILASNIVAKETSEKTIEFLLSKPVLRREIITQKVLAVATNVVLLNVIIVILSVIGFQFSKDVEVPMKTFALLCAATTMLHMTFAAVSFLLSSIMRKTRNIVSISMGIVFIQYFFHIMSGVSDKLESFKHISLFSYVDSANIIINDVFELKYVLIMTTIIILSILCSFMIYQKKDITV